MKKLPGLFRTAPAVFAAGGDYQIMVPVNAPALFWVEVGGKTYYDHSCGIMRSETEMHRVCVPRRELDAAGAYTTVYRKIIERKPYFPTSEDEVRTTFAFRPVPTLDEKPEIRFYHLSDVHGRIERGIASGSFFGDGLDFLVMNGDVIDHAGNTKNFDAIFKIAEALTGGEKPVVYARGNHDLRGFCAEQTMDYTPCVNGKTYYTARVGSFWFVILDCAEDKEDWHAEYGHTVACHPYRLEQTDFLERVIADAENEYAAEDVKYRFVLVHNPFTRKLQDPFGIEGDIFGEWARLLREEIHPDLMLCGHIHENKVYEVGGPYDDYGQACPVSVTCDGADPFTGGAYTVTKDGVLLQYTDSKKDVKGSYLFEKRN